MKEVTYEEWQKNPTPVQVETEQFLSGQPEQIEKIKENGGDRT